MTEMEIVNSGSSLLTLRQYFELSLSVASETRSQQRYFLLKLEPQPQPPPLRLKSLTCVCTIILLLKQSLRKLIYLTLRKKDGSRLATLAYLITTGTTCKKKLLLQCQSYDYLVPASRAADDEGQRDG